MMSRDWIGGLVKPLVFLASLAPFAWIVWRGFSNDLGTNPIETLNRYTGDWTLRFLLITLAITPLRRISGWHWLIRLRRMFGLFTFFYVCAHFLTWVWIDQRFELQSIVEDIVKRPFITLGFACFVLLVPLAITSTNAMVRRLGGRRWQRLHRLVYFVAVGGVVHFLWLVKSDIREPMLYALILALLLGYRLWWELRGARRASSAQA